jgi:hypothetical protein
MALTIHSGVFRCPLSLAKEIAEYAGLDVSVAPYDVKTLHGSHDVYWLWEDRQTGGGGCRICWNEGIAWVSCHSGYPAADITDEVKELFRLKDAEEATWTDSDWFDPFGAQPHIYGKWKAKEHKAFTIKSSVAAARFFREGD